jgi:hypothetical protein
MAQATTIVVKYVNEPKADSKNGTIKDDKNNLWLIDLSDLSGFKPDMTYDIIYESFKTRSGDTLRKIKQFRAKPMGTIEVKPSSQPSGYTAKDEQIFVCGAYNNWMGKPGTDVPTEQECADFVNMQRRIWSRTFGGKPTVGDDMDDSIPF